MIVDSLGHNLHVHPLERQVSKMMCRFNLNWDQGAEAPENMRFLDEPLEVFCAQSGVKELRGNRESKQHAFSDEYTDVGCYTDLMRSRFPYVQYNSFTSKFQYNTLRERGADFSSKSCSIFLTP